MDVWAVTSVLYRLVAASSKDGACTCPVFCGAVLLEYVQVFWVCVLMSFREAIWEAKIE